LRRPLLCVLVRTREAERIAAFVLREKIRGEKNLATYFGILERETARMIRLMEEMEFLKHLGI
jgi:hypothetical protein